MGKLTRLFNNCLIGKGFILNKIDSANLNSSSEYHKSTGEKLSGEVHSKKKGKEKE